MLKIRVLNASKKELLRDLQRAPEFDQSALFKKIYEEEFGIFGGEPLAALIGDYEFGRHPEDMELIEKISQVAAAAHAPFLSAASAELLNLDSFANLGAPRDLGKIFDSTEYAKWKSFRQSDDSRYVALTMPHILMRLPYGKDTKPIEGFNYEEGVDGTDHSKYLWGNAAYALGARLTNAFANFGWCAAIRGVEGGGLVEGLPTHTFRTDEGDVALKCPTEVAITDRREKELADQGFVPLVHCKGTDYAAFFSVQSCNKPKQYDSEAANANARLSAQLPYILAVSRFAHYLKSMMRDKIGVLHVPVGDRAVPEQVDHAVRDRGRQRQPGHQVSVPAAGGPGGGLGDSRQAGGLPGDCVPAAAFPVGRADGFAAPGGGVAAVDEEVRIVQVEAEGERAWRVDYFLKIDGIQGESPDKTHKSEIEIESFSWGATPDAGTASHGGGGGAGKVQMQDFHFVMNVNKASPKLMLACAQGEHIKSAILTCRKAGKEQQEYLKVTFSDLLVSSYQTSGSGGERSSRSIRSP